MTLPSGLESVAEKIQEQNSYSQRWKVIPIDADMSEGAKRAALRLNAFGSLFYFSKFILNHDRLSPNLHGYMCRELERDSIRMAMEIPRDHFKCNRINQLVLISDGTYKMAGDLTPGDEVLSMTDDYQMSWTKIRATERGAQPCVRIKFRSGRAVECSLNHPFRKLLGWKRADELKIGDRIAIAGRIECPKATRSSKYAAILGWFLGDGSFNGSTVTKNNALLREKIISDAFLAGGTAHDIKYPSSASWTIRVQGLRLLFRRLGLEEATAYYKFVPAEIYQSRTEDIAALLRTLFACDATCNSNVGIVHSTMSEQLARDIQRLLLRFDIFSTVRQMPANHVWLVTIGASDMIQRFFDRIGWIKNHKFCRQGTTWRNNVPQEWRDILPKVKRGKRGGLFYRMSKAGIRVDNKYATSKEKLRRVAEYLNHPVLKNLASDDVYWDEVESIIHTGLQNTVDIETETGNYCVSDVVTHNSTIASVSAPMWWALPFSYQDEELMRALGYGDAWIRWMYRAHYSSTRTLIASEVIANARKIGAKISGHYESNSMFKYLYPEIMPKKSDKWNQDSMTQNRLDGEYHGEGTYDLLGIKGALQSRHYDRQVIDDPVGEKAIKSDLVMEATIDWIRKLPGAFDSDPDNPDSMSDQLFIGNRWSNRDVGYWLRKNVPEMQFLTHDAEGGCCELHPAGEPIFPEEFSIEKLRQFKQILGSYAYSCQFRNKPIDPEAVRFKKSWLNWYTNNPWKEPQSPRSQIVNWQQLSYEVRKELGGDNADDSAEAAGAMPKRLLMAMCHEVKDGEPLEDLKASDLDRFCLIDPNHSGEQGRARNAILVYGIYNRPPAPRRIYLLDCWAKASSHEEWIEKIIGSRPGSRGLAVKWKVHYIYGEFKAAGQVGWQYYFNERRKQLAMHDGLFSIRTLKVDRSPNAKHNRIIGMESIYENGFFWVKKVGCEQFLEEYEEYPNGVNIDLLDLAGYMPQTWGAGSRATSRDFMEEEIKRRNRIVQMIGPAGY